MDETPKMICDKAGQFTGCKLCNGAKLHLKNDGCNNGEPYHCVRANDAPNQCDPLAVLVMCVEATKYLLISYGNETVEDAFAFEHQADDLDVGSPYDNERESGMSCGFAVGSNQRIIKLEDATPKMIELSEQ